MAPSPKAVVRKLSPLVAELIMRKAVAQVERERIDAIQRRILAGGTYGGITEPRDSWHMAASDSTRYFARLHAEYLAAGYKVEPGYCPALIAEHEQLKAEWALIAAAEEFFPTVTNNKLLCGTKELGGLETRQKFIDLLCGLCVNAPKEVYA